MDAALLTVHDYQALLDRGWRRSGTFVYKPEMAHTCCPQYTIRLQVDHFQPNREQRKVLRRMERYLAGEYEPQTAARAPGHSTPTQGPTRQPPQTTAPAAPPAQGSETDGAASAAEQQGKEDPLDSGACLGAVMRAVSCVLRSLLLQAQGPGSGGVGAAQLLESLMAQAQGRVRVQAVSGAKQSKLGRRAGAAAAAAPAGTDSESPSAHSATAAGPAGTEKDPLQGAPETLSLTSNAAFVVAALLKGTGLGASAPGLSQAQATAEHVAQALAQQLRGDSAAAGFARVEGVKGHLNFWVASGTGCASGPHGSGSVSTDSKSSRPGRKHRQALHAASAGGAREDATLASQAPAPQGGGGGGGGGGGSNTAAAEPEAAAAAPGGGAPSEAARSGAAVRRLEVTLARSSFIEEEYELYRKYQMAVHNDPPEKINRRSYERFLVASPLLPVMPSPAPAPAPAPPPASSAQGPSPASGQAAEAGAGAGAMTPSCGYGAFHQQYRLEGRLVAVGVVDVLPRCLSSKYFFWDPDYAFLSLGKLGALREIQWVQEERRTRGTRDWEFGSYYMGYYIHSCPKMTYKGAYAPSELLCPLRYLWVPLPLCKPLLERSKYSVLSSVLPRDPAAAAALIGPAPPPATATATATAPGAPPLQGASKSISREGALPGRASGGMLAEGLSLSLGPEGGQGQGAGQDSLREAMERIEAEEGAGGGHLMEVDEEEPKGQGGGQEPLLGERGTGAAAGLAEWPAPGAGPCWPAQLSEEEAAAREEELSGAVMGVQLLVQRSVRVTLADLVQRSAFPDQMILSLASKIRAWCNVVGAALSSRIVYQL